MATTKRRRSYGTGSIEQLPSGAYRARIWIRGSRRMATRATHGGARQWLEEQIGARRNLADHLGERPRSTLADLRDEWLAECERLGRTEKTIRGYTSALDAVLELHPRLRIADVTPGLLRAMVADFGKRWAASTARNRINVVTAVCRYAMEMDYVPARALPVRRPPIDFHSRPEAYSATECDSLLRAATAAGPRHELAIRLGLDAGLRLGEAFLTRSADLRARVLRVPKTKNGRPRSVPVPARLVAAWEAVTPQDGWMVKEPSWTTETPLDVMLRPVYLAAGVPYGFHRLRHTWASRLANGPDPATPWELMTWGGWLTMAMVTRYYHAPQGIRRGPVDAEQEPRSGGERASGSGSRRGTPRAPRRT